MIFTFLKGCKKYIKEALCLIYLKYLLFGLYLFGCSGFICTDLFTHYELIPSSSTCYERGKIIGMEKLSNMFKLVSNNEPEFELRRSYIKVHGLSYSTELLL